jgi:hypothetical protein
MQSADFKQDADDVLLARQTEDTMWNSTTFYEQRLQVVMSSLPLLLSQFFTNTRYYLSVVTHRLLEFVSPQWEKHRPPALSELWQMADESLTFSEFMLQHFDSDGDGHISSKELLNLTEAFVKLQKAPETWWIWFSREWPLMDWKVGVFVWKSFGGILFLLACFSILPGPLHRISAKILRWPVLGLIYFLIVVELIVYVIIRIGIRVAEYLIAKPKHRKLRQQMADATSYEEWYYIAAQLDKSQKRDKWLKQVHDETSSEYNWGFISELIKDLKLARSKGDSIFALAVIQQCTRKNVGGVMSEDLFSYSNTGEPKAIVREFIDEVVSTLHWITDEALRVGSLKESSKDDIERYELRLHQKVVGEKKKLFESLIDATMSFLDKKDQKRDGTASMSSNECSIDATLNTPIQSSKTLPAFHREQVLMFLKRARAAYGRTALCLSGGAMMGCYHFGVIKALLEANCLPHIISGTSAGSVVGAIVCTRTDDEILADLRPEVLCKHLLCFNRPWADRMRSVWKTGNMFDFDYWIDLIKWFTRGQTTFLEAYRRTGRIFCITLSSTSNKSPPVLLNYMTAPNVTIASAVVASAAVPGFIDPVRLQVKDDNGVVRKQGGEKDQAFWDGSIQRDIPSQGLAEMLNCQVRSCANYKCFFKPAHTFLHSTVFRRLSVQPARGALLFQ